MGLKKIAELRAELEKKAAALSAFTASAKMFSDAHAKIFQAYENLEKLRLGELAKVEGLNTLGIKEFEDYKKSLVFVYSRWSDRPLPLKPLEAIVAKQRAAVDAAVQERVAKMAASFPAEIKPGMVFRSEATKELKEIVSGPEEYNNPHLKGDAKMFYEWKTESGAKGGYSLSLAELKKDYKFIKS